MELDICDCYNVYAARCAVVPLDTVCASSGPFMCGLTFLVLCGVSAQVTR